MEVFIALVFDKRPCLRRIDCEFYLFIYFAHQVTILKRKNSDKNKIIEQSLMAWQHKDVGITPTNANSHWWRGNTRMVALRQQTLTVSDGVATQRCWHYANKRQQSLMAWQHKDVGITPTNANSLWWRGNTRMLASRQQTLTVTDGVATQGCWHHANKR